MSDLERTVTDLARRYRVSFNRWELVKRGGEWRIARRTTRLLGHAEAKALLRDGLAAH